MARHMRRVSTPTTWSVRSFPQQRHGWAGGAGRGAGDRTRRCRPLGVDPRGGARENETGCSSTASAPHHRTSPARRARELLLADQQEQVRRLRDLDRMKTTWLPLSPRTAQPARHHPRLHRDAPRGPRRELRQLAIVIDKHATHMQTLSTTARSGPASMPEGVDLGHAAVAGPAATAGCRRRSPTSR